MNWSTILNLSGLIINMAGAFVMYYYSSKVSSNIIIYTRAEAKENSKKDSKKNRMIRFGMLLLFIGFAVQFIAFFIK